MGHSMTQLIESVLGGGGQMGERMRALDWSTTALGPLEQWPQSLRISVRIVLGSGYPMTIYWGPEYTLLYNDAATTRDGNKAPGGIGPMASGKYFPKCGIPSDPCSTGS